MKIATLGDGDGLRLWSADKRTILHRAPLPSPGLCVAYWSAPDTLHPAAK